jgi:hypothetical protein
MRSVEIDGLPVDELNWIAEEITRQGNGRFVAVVGLIRPGTIAAVLALRLMPY